jgi:hypothetical protein
MAKLSGATHFLGRTVNCLGILMEIRNMPEIIYAGTDYTPENYREYLLNLRRVGRFSDLIDQYKAASVEQYRCWYNQGYRIEVAPLFLGVVLVVQIMA